MIRKNKKNILKLLLLVGVLSIGKNNVNAAQATDNTINADICIGGYYHSFSVSKENSNFDFYKVANLSISDLEKQAGYSLKEPGIFNINVDGVQVEFIYSFTRNFRCYTAMQKGNPSQVDSSAQYYHNGYNYIVKNCGNKYSINNLLFDTGTDGTNTVDASNGTISVVVRPKKGSTLDNDEVWKRLSADISYNGTPDYGKTGVGTCQTGSDATGRYMKCSGIAPYHRGWSMDTKKYNSDSYKLSFSLKGVTADDFTEKSEDKGKYVESCGGADGTIYLGEITTEIIDENKVMVNNPALTDPDLKAKCNELEKLNDEIKKSGLKGNSLKQCHDAKIKYTSSSKEKVTEALDKLKNTLESQKKAIESWSNTGSTVPGDSTTTSDLFCTNPSLGIPSEKADAQIVKEEIVYEKNGTYFGMQCKEVYYQDGGKPSLVAAGMGTEYSNKLQVKKECTIYKTGEAKQRPLCEWVDPVYEDKYCPIKVPSQGENPGTEITVPSSPGIERLYCSYEADMWFHDDPDTPTGGPNLSFDSCIKECDGGKYTQSCINSCYKSSYNNDRSNMLSGLITQNFNFNKNYELTKIYTDDGADCHMEGNIEVCTKQVNFNKGDSVDILGCSATWENKNGKLDMCDLGQWVVPTKCTSGPVDVMYNGSCALSDPDIKAFQIGVSDSELSCMRNWYSKNPYWAGGYLQDMAYVDCPGDFDRLTTNTDINCATEGTVEITRYCSVSTTPGTPGSSGTTPGTTDEIVETIYEKCGQDLLTPGYFIPANCSQNPSEETEYKNAIASAKEELKALQEIAKQHNEIEEYTISFQDSLTGGIYKVTGNSTKKEVDGPQLEITSSVKEPVESDIQEIVIGVDSNGVADPNAKISTPTKITTEVTYEITMPEVQVHKTNSETLAVINNNFSTARYYSYNSQNTNKEGDKSYFQFQSFGGYNSNDFYPGVKGYYTNINSPFTNVSINSAGSGDAYASPVIVSAEGKLDSYHLDHQVDNIFVTLKIGGNSIYKSYDGRDLACYYGVYPYIIKNDEDHGENIKNKGLRYYYREIDLKDVFPNDREPRYNWQQDANGDPFNADYVVNASKLIEDIEKKNDSIFTDDSEIDYQFVMTPALIKQIRNYSKGKSHTEFSLVADSTNKFNYSQKVREWYQSLNTTKITDCNNAKGGTCVNYK